MGLDEREEEQQHQQQQEDVEVQAGLARYTAGAWAEEDLGNRGVSLDAMTCSVRQIFESAFYGARAPRELGVLVMYVEGGCASKLWSRQAG